MCIVGAKYLKSFGWVLVKNRDQDYISDVTFQDQNDPTVGEIMCLYDHNTHYREGMNQDGLTIITTSLSPILTAETDSKDGDVIHSALHKSSPEEAAKFLISKKITGFIFIATSDKLILLEAARKDQGKGEYKFKQKIIPKTETVVRTNHGIDLPWAGFQYGYTDEQDLRRKSSELRLKYAELALKKAKDPVSMLDAFSSKMDNDLQMNLFRVGKDKQMRTIFQWALVPSEDLVYIRPIRSKIRVKIDPERIKVILVDNENIRKTYGTKIKHFARIIQQGNEFKTTQLESFKRCFTFLEK